jgi:hypothetical protein
VIAVYLPDKSAAFAVRTLIRNAVRTLTFHSVRTFTTLYREAYKEAASKTPITKDFLKRD